MNTTLLETGDNSWCHFRSMEREKGGRNERGIGGGHSAWVSWVNEAGVRDPQIGGEKKKCTHSNIRLKRDNMLYL